ncbi:unnamed protein product [Staurois parvus]|uniref:Uncharacterized protein n=1 Tax=Staurois parvus TaxID=386267 RepID=A0ABN9EJ14_9NEOB|nr:unnamed protein product [Staurois parvus]
MGTDKGTDEEALIAGWTDQLMGPPGNRGSWGPCVLAQTQKSL